MMVLASSICKVNFSSCQPYIGIPTDSYIKSVIICR